MYCSHHVQEVCNCTKTLTQWAQLQTFHLSVFHLSCHASPLVSHLQPVTLSLQSELRDSGALTSEPFPSQVSCTQASHFSQPMQLYQITCTLTPHQITSSDGSSSGLPSFCNTPTSPSGSHPGILVFPLGVAVILRLANCAPPKSHSYATYSTYCAAPSC